MTIKTNTPYGAAGNMVTQAVGLFAVHMQRNSTINLLSGKMPKGEAGAEATLRRQTTQHMPIVRVQDLGKGRGDEVTSGSSVMVVWEGTRPLLVEIQALVDQSMMANPRRVAVGLEQNRLAILLAVLHRHGGLQMSDQDVFVNVVGGVKVTETSADLALLLAMVSSLRDRPLPHDLVVFGEVGLAGEIRPVPSGQERISEAAKHGFRRAIVPAANVPKKLPEGMQVFGVKKLADALGVFDDLYS